MEKVIKYVKNKVAGLLSNDQSNDQQVNENNVSDEGILSKKNPPDSLYYEYEGSNDFILPIETQKRIKDNESIGGKPEYMPYQLKYKDKKDEEIEKFFKQDLKTAADRVDKLVDKNKIDSTAYGILVEMAYQMGSNIEEGTGLAGFTQTLQHINSGQYDLASKEMLKSKWHKQTPGRAKRLSNLMANIK